MAQVFLSYDRGDAAKARVIAQGLERAGHFVWWDLHIKGGAEYGKVIEQALADAESVVVLWSTKSVDSAWVRDEAAAGRDGGRLIPVLLEPVAPPMGFRQYQNLDFSTWKGRGRPPRFAELLESIEALGGGVRAEPRRADVPAPPAMTGRRRSLPKWAFIVGAITLTLIAIGLFVGLVLNDAAGSDDERIVAVLGADADAKPLARDLFVQLGNLGSTADAPIDLVDESVSETPDLILEVSGSKTARRPFANLVLMRGKDRQLLSSHAFEAPDGRADDLTQALTITAARLVECAATGLGRRNGRLREANLKAYVNACDAFAMSYGTPEVSIVTRQFEQLVRMEPQFAPAWKQLLLLEASTQVLPSEEQKPSKEDLLRQIAAARRLDPGMPEAAIAQMELLRLTDFEARIRRSDELVREFPDNPFVLGARSDQLMRVGRMNDAVNDAEQASRIDPLSPITRNDYIRSLAYSGRIPRAFQELEEAAPLALGAQNLREARFRLNMRYGDARLALTMLRSYGTSRQHEAFLEARIDPNPANIDKAISISQATSAKTGYYGSHVEVLAAFGRDDEIYELLMRMPGSQLDSWLVATLFRPNLKNFRRSPRFLAVARRMGMLRYWQASGKWPDFCFEPDQPYDCKAEAARLG